MIPDGWTETTLAEIADVIDCKHRTPSYADSGIPLISPGNISWGKLDLDNCKCVVHDDYVSLMDHCKVDLGDLVMGRNQSFGIASYVYDDRIFALGQDTILIKPKGCDSKFLYQIIQSPLFQEQINRLSSGSTFKRINLKDIRSLQVLAPKLDCQIKIAEVLGVWDESIDLLERLMGRVRSRKQGLMQQLLTGKKRFKEFEDSEWKEYQLSQIANITMGTSPKSESYNSSKEGLPLLQGNADIKNRVSAPRIWTTEITKECYPIDILISVRAPVGTIAISLHHACIGRGIASIKAKSKVLPNYLYQLLLFSEPKWASLSQGSTFDSVNSADIKSRIFSIPLMIPEQEKIAAVLSAADEEISTLEQQLAAYKQQKLGLMQQLLTGKIRVGMI